LFAALSVAGVALISPRTAVTAVLDTVAAVMVLGPAVLGGYALLPIFGAEGAPRSWRFVFAAALGIGLLGIVVLTLGGLGVLHRTSVLVLLGFMAVAGVVRLRAKSSPYPSAAGRGGGAMESAASNESGRLLWLLCPSLALGLLAAMNAPGFLWQEEGWGYDALEYHLQLPKEYLAAGAIEYLPHNVYANFPSQMEMLYLVVMAVLDGAVDAGTACHMVHLVLGGLGVFAVWVTARTWSASAAAVAAVVFGTCGWISYLCGLAYVELGMLFFGAAAWGGLLRAVAPNIDSEVVAGELRGNARSSARMLLLSGVLGGLACACKYTAVVMIALPIAASVGFLTNGGARARCGQVMVWCAGCLIAFSPWLIKNVVLTGNPVFPLMNEMFSAAPAGFGAEETAHWNTGHAPKPGEASLVSRLQTVWSHILADRDQRFGPAMFIIALLGLVMGRRNRIDWSLAAIFAMQFVVWLWFTHLYARFAVVWLIPLSLLCGRAVVTAESARVRRMMVALVVVGAGWNVAFAAQLHHRENPGGAPAVLMYTGEVAGFEYYGAVNRELPADARVLLVGEARAFYFQRPVEYWTAFNRNPFYEQIAAGRSGGELVAWLRDRGITHLLVHWTEIERIAATYGFAPAASAEQIAEAAEAMRQAGMVLIRPFHLPGRADRYVEFYRVAGEGEQE
jgi:hypothetical protein